MAVKIDFLLQDFGALILAVDANRTVMDAKGFTEASYTTLTTANENLMQKEAAQQKAVE